jgi:DNA polymerase-3 subunit gamma/tau
MMAAEMAIIRLTHVADLPSPEELVRKLHNTTPPAATSGPVGGGGGPSGGAHAVQQAQTRMASNPTASGQATALAQDPDAALARFASFEHVVELIRANRDVKLLVEVETTLRLAAYQPGRVEFVPTQNAPRDLAQRLGAKLQQWTGNRWAVTIVNDGGGKTIAELRDAKELDLRAKAEAHPLMQAVLAKFPKARITAIRTPEQIAAAAVSEALPEVEDEWDPFEDG